MKIKTKMKIKSHGKMLKVLKIQKGKNKRETVNYPYLYMEL